MEGEGRGLRERLQQEPRAGCEGGGPLAGHGAEGGHGLGGGWGGRVAEWGWEPGRRRGRPAEELRFPPRLLLGWRQAGRAQHPGSRGPTPRGHVQQEPSRQLSILTAQVTPAPGPSPVILASCQRRSWLPVGQPWAGSLGWDCCWSTREALARPWGPRAVRLGGAKSSMAVPAGKESRTGSLQPRAQKGRVRRAVRISSLVAQEVGDPLSTLSFSWAGTLRQVGVWPRGIWLQLGRGLLRSRTDWEPCVLQCGPSLSSPPWRLARFLGFPLPWQPLSYGFCGPQSSSS